MNEEKLYEVVKDVVKKKFHYLMADAWEDLAHDVFIALTQTWDKDKLQQLERNYVAGAVRNRAYSILKSGEPEKQAIRASAALSGVDVDDPEGKLEEHIAKHHRVSLRKTRQGWRIDPRFLRVDRADYGDGLRGGSVDKSDYVWKQPGQSLAIDPKTLNRCYRIAGLHITKS